MKTLSKVITWVLVAIVLLGVVGMLYSFIGNGQRNFYIRYGSEVMPTSTDNLAFEKDACNVIYCGTLTGQKVEYTVTIALDTSNMSNTSFKLNDSSADFKYDLYGYDCTALFNVEVFDDYFVFFIPKDLTLTKILQNKYSQDTITDVVDVDLWEKDYFVLTVTDKVERSSTVIRFH
ncbi:MAG: hypothetical protein K2L52_03535 [Clostridia bacterium]|nr:hypothetical protein [Clostridia bacterium]